jgi:amino acid adenylation domain-containing protein/thioester reductase-like protein
MEKLMQIDRTVLNLFMDRVAAAPNATALSSGSDTLTYQELSRRSDAVARFLASHGVGSGSVVPVEGTRSVDFIVAMVGVLKANAAYIPIDSRYPAERKQYLIAESGSRIVLTALDCPRKPDAAAFTYASVSSLTDSSSSTARAAISGEPSADDLMYVIFTSGTTGVPKGVMIQHHSVSRLVQWHNEKFSVTADSRMPVMAGLGFDVCQWEIWSALAAGATLFLPDEETRVDASALVDFYHKNAITHAFVPTVMVPDVVRASRDQALSLTYLFTAGEKLMPVDTDGLTYALIDYYGPTEATIFATVHHVPGSQSGKPASIGRPVTDTEILILTDRLEQPKDGETGELFIAGSCLARGYLNNEALTREKFPPHPLKHGARMYRTGDLARWLPDGTVQYLGRTDDQVKIRGNRVELGEIEAFLARLPSVRKAAVIVTSEEADARKEIVACVVRENRDAMFESVVQQIRADARRLPDYMRPSRYIDLADIPLTVNGKTDKALLRARHVSAARDASSQIPQPGAREKPVLDAFASVLGHRDFGAHDSFFDIGGDSLLVAQLVSTMTGQLGEKVYIRDVYECQNATALAQRLEGRSRAAQPRLDAEPVHALQRDIELRRGITFKQPFDNSRLREPRAVVLTGATGFVGVHLLDELLRTTNALVHCTVRAANDSIAASRIDEALRTYRIEPGQKRRIIAHAADLSLPEFGMAHDDYLALCRDTDVIYHSASAVNFIQPYSYMKRDNVDALKEVIAFAARDKLKALMLLSTISVYSWGHLHTGKTVMTEGDDIDQNLPAVMTDIGYVRSKWVMEKIADLASSMGLPLATFRLGYATFNSDTGLGASYQWWGRLVETCIRLRAVPDLRELREGLTTVDYMVRAIAHISRNPACLGTKFNLIHSDRNNLTLTQFFSLLERHFGFKFDFVPFSEWLAMWKHDSEAPLFPLLSLFVDNMYDGRSTVELYQDTYRWDCSNVSKFLAGSGINEPVFTREELEKYLAESIGVSAAVG